VIKNMNIKNEYMKKNFYSKLPHDNYNLRFTNGIIKMKEFLSFLTVPVIKSTDNLGKCNGWTEYRNKEHSLIINGGKIYNKGGIEYLDNIQYGNRLDNPYNNYVNPFYIFDIMNEEGKKFFVDFYKEDIDNIIDKKQKEAEDLKKKLEFEEYNLYSIIEEKQILCSL
jgi:hypothetical protein